MSKHATLVSRTKSPHNFLPDFYISQTCLSCLECTSPWISLIHYYLHNGTEFGMTLFSYINIIQILQNWVSMKQDNWAQHLPLVAYVINIFMNDTTKMSSFYL